MATSQFKEWMDDYETKLREGVQKRFGLMDGISDKTRLDDEKQEKDQGESQPHSDLQSPQERSHLVQHVL